MTEKDRRHLSALDASSIEKPSGGQRVHEGSVGISRSHICVLSGFDPVHRRESKGCSACRGQLPQVGVVRFWPLLGCHYIVVIEVDQRHGGSIGVGLSREVSTKLRRILPRLFPGRRARHLYLGSLVLHLCVKRTAVPET